jgi:dihydroorotate dehydrogenase
MQLSYSKLGLHRNPTNFRKRLSLRPMIYPFLRDTLFLLPPEQAHHISMEMLKKACRIDVIRDQLKHFFSPPPGLDKHLFGLHFPNPVGLAAGFDKNALYLRELEVLGFGFVEIGTVTPKPQPGNEAPRVFRLPKDKALINRMGFNNDGVMAVAERLRRRNTSLLIGGNIGKNKVTPNEDAWRDYEICFKELFDCVDYFVVNVSSPNTPGLRALQEKESLLKILGNLQHINNGHAKPKPLLLKIAPDLTESQLEDIMTLTREVNLSGLVATNTTISREGLKTPSGEVEKMGAGGLSGLPLRSRSTEVVSFLCHGLEGKIPVIASGGIFTAADAKEKLNAGASLVQLWTGFIYEGPSIVKNICAGLSKS